MLFCALRWETLSVLSATTHLRVYEALNISTFQTSNPRTANKGNNTDDFGRYASATNVQLPSIAPTNNDGGNEAEEQNSPSPRNTRKRPDPPSRSVPSPDQRVHRTKRGASAQKKEQPKNACWCRETGCKYANSRCYCQEAGAGQGEARWGSQETRA